jgi:hypothetical protein
MSGWDLPRLWPRINRVTWGRRFWLVVPHKRKPHLSLTGKPVAGGVLADVCRRCNRKATRDVT